jgi:uncharacterized membrane protein YqaE (UPF0057 family)
MTAGNAPLPAAGWYPDPQMAGTQRYWDGAKWSDHVAPLDTRDAAVGDRGGAPGLNWGHWLMAFLIPPLAVVMGISELGRRPRLGAQLIAVGLVAGAAWAVYLLARQ